MGSDVPAYCLCPKRVPARMMSRNREKKLMLDDQSVAWYVLRVTYQREFQAKTSLERLGIETFVPERLVRRRDRQGRFSCCREAAIHNYLFVRSSKSVINELKTYRLPILRYVMHVENGVRVPMTVPDVQMRNFIAIAGNLEARILYLSPEDPDLTRGDRVRITGGPFAGVEGTFVKLRKAREWRVVVTIEGVAAVATTSVPASLVEKIS